MSLLRQKRRGPQAPRSFRDLTQCLERRTPRQTMSDTKTDPLHEFLAWYGEAAHAHCQQPEAMALATASLNAQPSVRIVLFRGMSGNGLRFFTNYQSRKAEELLLNPACAAVFHWAELGRQVRFEGRTERLSMEESDAYFAQRPRGHQLGAWASSQSRPLSSRDDLVSRWDALGRAYEGRDVPRPPHWGGYRLVPHAVELWVEAPDRLHRRTRYDREGATWRVVELEP